MNLVIYDTETGAIVRTVSNVRDPDRHNCKSNESILETERLPAKNEYVDPNTEEFALDESKANEPSWKVQWEQADSIEKKLDIIEARFF